MQRRRALRTTTWVAPLQPLGAKPGGRFEPRWPGVRGDLVEFVFCAAHNVLAVPLPLVRPDAFLSRVLVAAFGQVFRCHGAPFLLWVGRGSLRVIGNDRGERKDVWGLRILTHRREGFMPGRRQAARRHT